MATTPATANGVERIGRGRAKPSRLIVGQTVKSLRRADMVALMPSEEGQTPESFVEDLKLKGGGFPTPLFIRAVYACIQAILTCRYAKDGKELWKERVKARSPSPVAGDGHLHRERKGLTSVASLGTNRIEAKKDLADDILATPAMRRRRVFMQPTSFFTALASESL